MFIGLLGGNMSTQANEHFEYLYNAIGATEMVVGVLAYRRGQQDSCKL